MSEIEIFVANEILMNAYCNWLLFILYSN